MRWGGHSTKVQNFFLIYALGRSLHEGTKFFPNFTQPHFTGSKLRRCFRRALDHFVASWQHLSICFWRQLNVGGMFSRDRPPYVKRIRLAVLTLSVLSVELYRTTINFSICAKFLSVTKSASAIFFKSWSDFRKLRPRIMEWKLPLPATADVVSQPLRAWKKEIALEPTIPRPFAISWTGIYCKIFSLPNSIHNYSTLSNRSKTVVEITITSL